MLELSRTLGKGQLGAGVIMNCFSQPHFKILCFFRSLITSWVLATHRLSVVLKEVGDVPGSAEE